jgi:hypothetical protein
MHKIINCKLCKKELTVLHNYKGKYCNICRKKARIISGEKFKINHTKVLKIRYCIQCNVNILAKGVKKFCSAECKKIFNKNLKKYRFVSKKINRYCIICNNIFLSKHINHKCCSKKCYIEHRTIQDKIYSEKIKLQKPVRKINCRWCNVLFEKPGHYYFCSEKCKIKSLRYATLLANKRKYKNDINYRLKVLLRTRFKRAIKNKSKRESALKLIGCTIPELINYIEKQFQTGMSWDNYAHNTWHIDHIIPCAAFDLTKLEEQKKCFHYTNLQPLWADENYKKNDKLVTNNV